MSLFLIAEYNPTVYISVYMYTRHILFIHSSISGHLGCFHIWAFVNDATRTWECAYLSYLVFISFKYISRSVIAELW